MMNVPFLDLKPGYLASKSAIDEALARVASSGWYLLGGELASFEAHFANSCGAKHCVGVGNGLDALHLGLLALEVGPGDEVIVPSNTYIATWLAVTQCGAKVVPVEPVAGTYNIDSSLLDLAITANTKVILPVHLYGQPADMDAIREVANRHDLKVMDDCAQAHCAIYKDRRIGSLADISAWSFYPGKNLGAFGDAGAITTESELLAQRVRTLGNYGSRVKYHNEVKGFNSRLDEIQAAVLEAKLPRLQEQTVQRRQIAKKYLEGMTGLPIVLPEVAPYADPSWHLFVVRHAQRDAFQKRLKEKGIDTLIHYPVPPHLQPAYAELGYKRGDFPVAEAIHDEVLSLPLWPGMQAAQIQHVIDMVRICA